MGATSSWIFACLAVSACTGADARKASSPLPAVDERPRAAAEALDRAADATLARSSARCGECHVDIAAQWSESAHAGSATGALYSAMVRDLGAERAVEQCDRCHRPLAAVVDRELPVVAEGVTCDVCHSIAEVEVREHDATFLLDLAADTKYGPYCDAPDHYFHKMGCSPLHTRSQFCASCHVWDIEVGGVTIPVLEEYREWANGPKADTHDCQDCHMDRVDGEVAVGWEPRPAVNHHGLFGDGGARRQTALDLDARARRGGDELVVAVTLRNSGSAHYVPSGLPERRLVITAVARAHDGVVLHEDSVELGRRLQNDAGADVPFYRATRVGEDTRIPPDETRTVELRLPNIEHGRIDVRVALRRIDHEIAAQVGADPPEDIPLAAGHLDVAPTRVGAFLHEAAPGSNNR